MKIAFVVLPNMLATSFTNAYELFYTATQVNKAQSEEQDSSSISLHKLANQTSNVTLDSGLSINVDCTLEPTPYDLIFIPAMWRNPRPIVSKNQELIKWLRWQHQHGAILSSTGTGVWFIASAGLLDQKPATTHWYFFERFAQDFPNVELKRQHFITTAGNIYCAASVNALTDLCLHHIHRFFGREVADRLSHQFSHEVRQPYDKLSFNADHNTNHPDEQVLQVQIWMQNNYAATEVSVHALAKRFGMSSRNLSRRFKLATQVTPIEYLQQQRIQAARDLLQTSNLSIKEIAYRVGYLDVSHFSRLFKQSTGLTPSTYRSSMRAKLYSSS